MMKQGLKTKIAILMLAVSLPATSLLASTSVDAASVAAKRNKVVQTAISLKNKVQYVNWRDRQEAKPPYKTDCSGFTYLAYRLANVGVNLVNKDDDDQAKVGQRVSWGNLEKGDLVFFWLNSKNKSDVGHVGIYIGDGKMIHNITKAKDVIVSNIYTNSYYKDRFIVARRVIK
ncbi:C40 family peptidase [Paenibacillus harenae]|uniref:Cell wall-associated NlpC family hydrolase n=1 Tax=Paenibacillus harenae TaxID=306543 RepID=A0ABT9U976_PAEHA|nr:C40 family peptidase [Paenibacillus harenae]MDQ0116207.1 cell wall-associated NlpC family hydrolase [Paenibacillus harenae]